MANDREEEVKALGTQLANDAMRMSVTGMVALLRKHAPAFRGVDGELALGAFADVLAGAAEVLGGGGGTTP